MNKTERLTLIRERAKARPSLSKVASDILETLRSEDADLGSDDVGGVLDAEEVETVRGYEEEDEENDESTTLSPRMRELAHEAEKTCRRMEKEVD